LHPDVFGYETRGQPQWQRWRCHAAHPDQQLWQGGGGALAGHSPAAAEAVVVWSVVAPGNKPGFGPKRLTVTKTTAIRTARTAQAAAFATVPAEKRIPHQNDRDVVAPPGL
jgi:hypothetical protein